VEYVAFAIAETIIDRSRRRGTSDLTNLKLQKLIYYSQAWYLALNDAPLFSDDIEAWIHGPVVPRVFGMFKEYRWSVIERQVNPVDDGAVISHVDEVLDTYGKYGATELERLTHSEEPWIYARRGLAPDEPSRNVISTHHMKIFYRSLMGHA
jgi:uncharacterized phage-associated protein